MELAHGADPRRCIRTLPVPPPSDKMRSCSGCSGGWASSNWPRASQGAIAASCSPISVRMSSRSRARVEIPSGPRRRDRSHQLEGRFLHLNTNKRSVVIDPDAPDATEQLWRLLERADLVVEVSGAGDLARYGLSWATVHERMPTLVVVSISGFRRHRPLRRLQVERPDGASHERRPPAAAQRPAGSGQATGPGGAVLRRQHGGGRRAGRGAVGPVRRRRAASSTAPRSRPWPRCRPGPRSSSPITTEAAETDPVS